MPDFYSVWDEAGGAAEQAEADRRMAVAKEASRGAQEFLFLATSEADFDNRVALVSDTLSKAAAAGGVPVEALVAEHRRGVTLVLEAKTAAMPPDPGLVNEVYGGQGVNRECPTCNGARAIPAQGHESFAEVSNGQVRCPSCHGHGVVAPRQTDLTEPERYTDPGDAQDAWYGGDYLASLKTALAEGQDPLEWLEQEGGQGQPEVEGGHTTGNEQTTPNQNREAGLRPFVEETVPAASRKQATVKEAFDWLRKNPATTAPAAPAAPAEDPLAGRAQCPCGSRMTAPMGGGSDKHKCWNCETVFSPGAPSSRFSSKEAEQAVNRPF